jgi:HEPN domain-containing protein
MTGQDESAFRLRSAQKLLEKADEEASRASWREAALFARAAVENAAKAVLACFTTVPKTHEPALVLEEAVRLPGFPAALVPEAQSLLPIWRRYGMSQHVLLSYGDEQNLLDPWSLATPGLAREALAAAQTAVGFAARCRAAVFGGG